MQGFTISNEYIGQPTANVSLTNATLINADNTGDISWWTAPDSPTPLTLPTGVGGLIAGRNYVELQIYAEDGTPLQRAFWDPSANSGQGTEFTQEVDTVTEMFVRVVINQSGFASGNPNLIKLAIIDLDGSLNIRGVRDRRDLFYRLGDPDDIDATYAWGTRVEPPTTLVFTAPAASPFTVGETVTFTSGATAVVQTGGSNNVGVFDFSTDNIVPGDTATGGTSGATATLQSYYESFTGADKDIRNMRDMLAALMNEIRVVKGTRFWYEVGSAASLPTLLNYVNAMVAPISAGARYLWNGTAMSLTDDATTGQASSDVIAAIRIPGYSGNLYLTREDGTGGSAAISVPDGSLIYVDLPTAGVSRTFSESGPGTTNFRVVSRSAFVPSDSKYILAYREGAKVIIPGTGELQAGESAGIGDGISPETLAYIGASSESATDPQYPFVPSSDLPESFSTSDNLTTASGVNAENINALATALLSAYQERLSVVVGTPASDNEVQGPLAVSAELTLPLDSRQSNAQREYVVGAGGLSVYLNGLMLSPGVDYDEVGTSGDTSDTIELLIALVVGDVVDFRSVTPASIQ